jgi:glycine cleavage system T protein
MKQLPLNKAHKSLGANLQDYSGWTAPADYGDKLSEYKAVRENVGIIDLSSRGKLRLSGKDHLKFLQGMLSNDVIKLEEGQGVYATILTVKGRMISDMKVYKDKEFILLDLEPGLNQKVLELLTKFRLSYKASIDDFSETAGLISIQGPQARKLLEMLFEEGIPQMEELNFIQKEFMASELMIACVNRTGEEGFDLYIENKALPNLWEDLLKKGQELNIKTVGYDALDTLRIEAGLPIYNIDMDENNIPIEAGLWNALDFEKGCYVGQEVVARIKWRGHVNWHLMGFECDGELVPKIGDEIFDGERKIGRITSSTFSAEFNKPLCLGYIRREFNDPGTKVSIKLSDNSEIRAEVAELPFYKGSFKFQENTANS